MLPRALLAGFVLSLFSVLTAWAETCRDDLLELRGPFGHARFTVEVADDDAERARGLMYRDYLPASSGMLFVYDWPGSPAFWMKNTLIPLDMIYITPEGRVQFVRHMAQPGDLRGVSGGPGVQYVLEIRGGLARAMGIVPGSEIRHPALDPAIAAWPCGGDENAGQ